MASITQSLPDPSRLLACLWEWLRNELTPNWRADRLRPRTVGFPRLLSTGSPPSEQPEGALQLVFSGDCILAISVLTLGGGLRAAPVRVSEFRHHPAKCDTCF